MIYQLPLLLYDDTAQAIEQRLRQMCYDDVLIAYRRGWRLEYLYLNHGFPHYRLLHGCEVIGVVDVRSPSNLLVIRRDLACYLAGLGFTPKNMHLVIAGASTKLNAKKAGHSQAAANTLQTLSTCVFKWCYDERGVLNTNNI